MTQRLNHLGQPIGPALDGWTQPPPPPRGPLAGRFCRLEPVDPDRHAEPLFGAYQQDTEGRNWTYLPYGPFDSLERFDLWLRTYCLTGDPLFFAIINAHSGMPEGLASYCRIDPSNGSIEVGHIHYSERLKRSRAATEAMFLMMRQAFELGFRRYEWKCDALNAPSREAAQRLGFTFEGIFRQARVYKGRSRDTAWFSMVDSEWPALQRAFLAWLDPSNFDASGHQRTPLQERITEEGHRSDPRGRRG